MFSYPLRLCQATMLVLLMLMCALGQSTSESKSKMAWLKSVLDHHDWQDASWNSTQVSTECASQLSTYVTALNQGQLWASKVFDASGSYSTNMLFGSDYWLGSMISCRDLQLSQYYNDTPPYPFSFMVAKLNLTIDDGHIPQSRVVTVGECLPRACSADAVSAVVSGAVAEAVERAHSAQVPAHITVLGTRTVPGTYSLFTDHKAVILGSAALLVLLIMLIASLYEGYLEREKRLANQQCATRPDLELSHHNNNNNHKPTSNDISQSGEKADGGTLRREARGLLLEILLSFSILSNGRTILSTQKPADGALTCLHGMRFISVVWVVMVHTYLTLFYIADNKTLRAVTERNFFYQSIGNASYSVDTFFFISGLLVTVLFLRSEEKHSKKTTAETEKEIGINKNKNGFTNSALSVSVVSQSSFEEDMMDTPKRKCYTFNELIRIGKTFSLMIFYRFIRLTPVYAFVVGFNMVTLRYANNQSVFEPAVGDHITCDLFWWRNLLYINNLYSQREMCMVWSWYMANDTQFYVIGILLLLISAKHFKFSAISLIVLMVSSWVISIYISVWYQYRARIQEPFEMFDPLYDKPWSRIGPYFVGMIVGWYLHKTKCQVKMPYWLVAVCWPTALAIMGVLIFGMVDGYFEVWPTAFYVSVGHTGWGCALAWVTVACCTGYGGLVNSALSYQGLLPLSRLTYCTYLVHPTIMIYVSFLMDGPLHLQNSMIIIIYAGFAVTAFLVSFILSLAFEAPAVRLLKIISRGGPKR